MRHVRVIGLGVALAAGIAGQSPVDLSGQTSPARAAGPFDSLHFRQIGPAGMSGRVADLAVYEANPALFYVATAHGGVWKTTNNGTTWEAQLQDQGNMSFGDVTISQSNPDLVWVGGGESSNRQSVSWGDGVYKSTDGGRTYTNMGLETSRHINRIVIDPRDNDTVFVAATGSLWGPGGERGVYKTTDAGRTWKQVLKVDDDTGANDIVMDPTDSRILYATMYQRRRTACCFNGGGTSGGIFKSTDGGETWTRLKGGVLDGPVGRIAVDVYRRRPNILYALIEGPAQPGGRPGGGGRGAQELNDQPTGMYRSDDSGGTWRKVNNANPRPMYFSQIDIDPNDPEIVYTGGVGLHQTLDGGKTIATDIAQPIHDDVHAIWINPANSLHILIGNDGGLAKSYDRGRQWIFVPNLPVGLFYHVSVDMARPYNICGGMQDNYNWCGPSAVRSSAGIGNHEWKTLQGGDGFHVLQDPADFRTAYSESQDGNIVRVDRVTGETMSIRPHPGSGEPALRWHWDTPLMLSPHDPKVFYAAANKVFRSTDRGLSWTAISEDLTDGQDRDEIVTMGAKGRDIRFSRHDGISQWPAIVSFAESPKRPGLLYAGTDDGNVAVTRDMGRTWTRITDRIRGIPTGIFVSELVPSRFDEGTVYATFDGHRQNDFETWVFASTDYGRTWRSIAANLEGQVVRTLTEDLKNPDVLYLGTETGIFVTLDRGRSWMRLKGNMPTVRVDEITLHPRDNAMVVATHGRAIWVLDHLAPIQEYAAAQKSMTDAALFSTAPAAMYRRPARDRNYEFWGNQTFFGENPPQAAVLSWLNKKDVGDVKLRITDAGGREVREIGGPVLSNSKRTGIHSACWDLRVEPVPAPQAPGGRQGRGGGRQGGPAVPPRSTFGAGCTGGGTFGVGGGGGIPGPLVLPGTYTVSLVVDGRLIDTRPLRVAADPDVLLTLAERKKLYEMAIEMHDLQRRTAGISAVLQPFNTHVAAVSRALAEETEVPADLRGSFETLQKELATTVTQFAVQAGGRRVGGAALGPVARLALVKNGVMGGMWPTKSMLDAYAEARAGVPGAIAEVDVLLSKAAGISAALASHGITLTVPSLSDRASTTSDATR